MADTLFTDEAVDEALALNHEELYGFPSGFAPSSEDDIERILARIAALEAEAARVTLKAQQMRDAALKQATWIRQHYGPQIEAYAKSAIARQKGKKRSYDPLNGTVGYRLKPAAIKLDPERAGDALEWAEVHYTQAVKTTKTLNWSALKEILAEKDGNVFDAQTGELLLFVKAEPAEDTFYVKAGA